jgi:hypothetical protein
LRRYRHPSLGSFSKPSGFLTVSQPPLPWRAPARLEYHTEQHPSRVIIVNGFEGFNTVRTGDKIVDDQLDVNAGSPESHSGVDIFAERDEGPRTQEKGKKPMGGQKCTWKDEVDLAHLPEKNARQSSVSSNPIGECGTAGTVVSAPSRLLLTGSRLRQAWSHIQSAVSSGLPCTSSRKTKNDRMIEQKVIEPATCEWASPIALVPKPDGSLRFCVDYGKLNSITISDTCPLPHVAIPKPLG